MRHPATKHVTLCSKGSGGLIVHQGEVVGGGDPAHFAIGEVYLDVGGPGGVQSVAAVNFGPGTQVTVLLRTIFTSGRQSLFLRLEVDEDAQPGPRNITVCDASGRFSIIAGGVTVTGAAE